MAGTLLVYPYLSVDSNFQNFLFGTGTRNQSSTALSGRLYRYTLVTPTIVAVKIPMGTISKSYCTKATKVLSRSSSYMASISPAIFQLDDFVKGHI
jgi:hypothetical protein